MKIKKIVSNALIVVLSLILVIGILVFIAEINSYNEDYYDNKESFLYAIQAKDYPRLIEVSHHNRVLENKEKEYEEYHGVADYFEAASYYKAYHQAGEEEKAEDMKEKMEKAKLKMGSYAYLQEEIHDILEIKEIVK